MTLPLTMETRPRDWPLVPRTAIKREPKQAKRTESQDSYYSYYSASESAAPAAPAKTRGNGGGEKKQRPREATKGGKRMEGRPRGRKEGRQGRHERPADKATRGGEEKAAKGGT